ncbi:hypothetical protein E4U53_006549 [Claviceps sorghi]|nr:hypothetical protein E4U53_006549 [Claviceps sorghi]
MPCRERAVESCRELPWLGLRVCFVVAALATVAIIYATASDALVDDEGAAVAGCSRNKGPLPGGKDAQAFVGDDVESDGPESWSQEEEQEQEQADDEARPKRAAGQLDK